MSLQESEKVVVDLGTLIATILHTPATNITPKSRLSYFLICILNGIVKARELEFAGSCWIIQPYRAEIINPIGT